MQTPNPMELRETILSSSGHRALMGRTNSDLSEIQDEFLVDWLRTRQMIEHEDSLINQRMTWLLTTNGFLYAAFFVAQKSDAKELGTALTLAIPIIGILVSFSILISLVAAMTQLSWIAQWWNWRKKLDPRNFALCPTDDADLRHPKIAGFGKKSTISHDLVITKILPSLIMSTWIVILGVHFSPSLRSNLAIPAWALLLAFGALAIITPILAPKLSQGSLKS